MIVLLDTTAIMADPTLESIAWKLLIHAREAWNVRVLVSEVTWLEAVAGYERRINELLESTEKWDLKQCRPLGIGSLAAEVKVKLRDASDGYAEQLNKLLSDSGVERMSIPNIAHGELVRRAAARQSPCNSRGDGYRDTLNWLMLIDIAKENSDEEVVWISNNTNDFGAADGALNPSLRAELEQNGIEGRVRWYRNVMEVALELAAKHAPDQTELSTISETLKTKATKDFILEHALSSTTMIKLDPKNCGLPLSTLTSELVAVANAGELELSVRGAIEETGSIAEFSIEADASIVVTVIPGAFLSEDDKSHAISTDSEGSWLTMSKRLLFVGTVSFNSVGRPAGAELSRVEALPGDEGVIAWSERGAAVAKGFILAFVEALRLVTMPSAQLSETIRQATMPSTQLSEAIRQAMMPSSTQLSETFRQAIMPSSTQLSETFRQAIMPLAQAAGLQMAQKMFLSSAHKTDEPRRSASSASQKPASPKRSTKAKPETEDS